MLFPIPASEYDRLVTELVETRTKREQEELEKVKDRATKMSLEEHDFLLDTVVRGHACSKHITIYYYPPGVPAHILHRLADYYGTVGWITEVKDDKLIIRNNSDLTDQAPDYDEHTYRRHKTRVDRNGERSGTIDFYIPEYQYTTPDPVVIMTGDLILFEHYIRVKLWGLAIPKDEVCLSSSSHPGWSRIAIRPPTDKE